MERSPKNMRIIFSEIVLFLFLLLIKSFANSQFVYNDGFGGDILMMDGEAHVTENGLLQLTDQNDIDKQGHAFYSKPLQLKGNVSFSTTFVIGIVVSGLDKLSGQRMAFIIAPQRSLPGTLSSQFPGKGAHDTNNGNSANDVLAVELDTIKDPRLRIEINGTSVKSTSSIYFTNGEKKKQPLSLDKEQIQVWVEYDAINNKINVTLAPFNVSKPDVPLFSLKRNLSDIFLEPMYIGFSASTQSVLTSHYVLGWSFEINGTAQDLNLSSLPKLPRPPTSPGSPPSPSLSPSPSPSPPPKPSKNNNIAIIVSAIIGSIVVLALLVIFGLYYMRKQKTKNVPVVSPSPQPASEVQKFSYSELEEATSVFSEQIGEGASGTVYRGILPNSESQVAVKKVPGDAKYGSREFTAEIGSLGKLRHQNLVFLHGYCEHEGQLLLVYDYMPNGSVDMFLYPKRNPLYCTFIWSQRFQIIKDVANGLYYLHKGLKQVVIHRDIKSSNVFLDDKMNARLGDFGHAKLSDHGADSAPTSRVVGYVAPEMQYGMPSTQTDVYAFGAFMLEIASGRRPHLVAERGLHLVDWVSSSMKDDAILNTADKRLRGEYAEDEMLLVLKLGLLCCRFQPTARPTIQKIVQHLNGDAAEADLRALNTVDEAPVRYVGGGNTPPRSGTHDIFLE
ncbi:hypothetical protein C5167_000699 [Papaver somniferum]|uniref:non-specific serine/threonine protein kinase n=1 Tax=Papaver somniferum TaxID=3469 RepID=A0A4Y7KU99_PAPSO|nr:L-type lectin-domain containing receptor kinase IV.2-like [Papaver somniferum]RZC75930.1 hypothetical protein C5167_000699 [Papaver somniferum]